MNIAIACRNALLRDSLVSVLRNDANLQVAGGSEYVAHAASMINGHGVLVVAAEGLEVDDWITLGELRSSGYLKVVLISSPEAQASYRAADIVVRSADGAAGLRQAATQMGMARAQVMVKGSVFAVNDNKTVDTHSRKGLTRRELEVGNLLAKGGRNREIALSLELQEQSVKNLVSVIMRKLDCENRTQVALKLMGQPTAEPEQGSAPTDPVFKRKPKPLTRREQEVASLLATGMSNREIALSLDLAQSNMSNVVTAIMRKLDCENRMQVALKLMGQPTAE